jgi:DNA-binding FrmR family transcriptional regulator
MNKDDTCRLPCAEGRGCVIARLVDEDTYCIDILADQRGRRRCQSVAVGLLDEHMRHCVRRGRRRHGSRAMIEEATPPSERLVRA